MTARTVARTYLGTLTEPDRAALSDRQDWVLTQHIMEGRSYADLGDELGVTPHRINQIARKGTRNVLRTRGDPRVVQDWYPS